jgi:hypothetical protein
MTVTLDEGEWSASHLCHFTCRAGFPSTQQIDGWMDQGQSGHCAEKKNLLHVPETEPQPIAHCYADGAILAPISLWYMKEKTGCKMCISVLEYWYNRSHFRTSIYFKINDNPGFKALAWLTLHGRKVCIIRKALISLNTDITLFIDTKKEWQNDLYKFNKCLILCSAVKEEGKNV